jgi:hypothetical protein
MKRNNNETKKSCDRECQTQHWKDHKPHCDLQRSWEKLLTKDVHSNDVDFENLVALCSKFDVFSKLK